MLARERWHRATLAFVRVEITDQRQRRPSAGREMQAMSLGVPVLQLKEKFNSVFISVFCFGVLDD